MSCAFEGSMAMRLENAKAGGDMGFADMGGMQGPSRSHA